MLKKKKYVFGARKAPMVSRSAVRAVVPHVAPTAVNITGPGEGRATIAERRDFNY